jgi:hypothetical protein
MESRRIEVRTVGPHKSMYFLVETNLIEEGGVAKRTVQSPLKDRSQIDCLRGLVIELNA